MQPSQGGQGPFPRQRATKKTMYQGDAEEDVWKESASSYRPSTCTFGTALTAALPRRTRGCRARAQAQLRERSSRLVPASGSPRRSSRTSDRRPVWQVPYIQAPRAPQATGTRRGMHEARREAQRNSGESAEVVSLLAPAPLGARTDLVHASSSWKSNANPKKTKPRNTGRRRLSANLVRSVCALRVVSRMLLPWTSWVVKV